MKNFFKYIAAISLIIVVTSAGQLEDSFFYNPLLDELIEDVLGGDPNNAATKSYVDNAVVTSDTSFFNQVDVSGTTEANLKPGIDQINVNSGMIINVDYQNYSPFGGFTSGNVGYTEYWKSDDSKVTKYDGVEKVIWRTPTGWRFFIDGNYTESSPLTVAAGDTAYVDLSNVTILGHPNSDMIMFDTITDRIVPLALFDTYDVRVEMEAKTTGLNSHVEIAIDVGQPNATFFSPDQHLFPEGINVPNSFSSNFDFWCGSNFIANGGRIALMPEDNTDFWGFKIKIERKHEADRY